MYSSVQKMYEEEKLLNKVRPNRNPLLDILDIENWTDNDNYNLLNSLRSKFHRLYKD